MTEHRSLRSSKRRKVSENKWAGGSSRGQNGDRDQTDRDVFEVPSDSDEEARKGKDDGAVNGDTNGNGKVDEGDEEQEDPFDVVLKETPRGGRRKVKAKTKAKAKTKSKTKVQEDEDEGEDENGDNDGADETPAETETPTRRSSARTRKPVQRLNAAGTTTTPTSQLPTRRALFTPSNSGNKKEKGAVNGLGGGSAGKPVSSPVKKKTKENMEKERQPRARSSRSSRKSAVRDVSSDDEMEVEEDGVPEVEQNQHPSEPVEEDGEDDIAIAQQLQVQQDQMQLEEELPTVQSEVLPDYAEEFKALCKKNGLERELGSLSSLVLEKLTGKRLIPLKGLQNEYQKVHQLIEHTVVSGEGNSMLLIGARGCGKTALVETALSSLKKEHEDDFYVVRLNGFLHTDDRVALREIWRQLGREMDVDDSMVKINNYADTMASLLALLSHPEELYGRSENPDVIQTAKSVIIVLDEFDLFASHPRQTLLYNLFDIAQSRKAPLAVLGVTTKVDVTENLEKRVKSRYSHRYVFLPRPRTLEAFSEACMAGLALEQDEIVEDPMDPLDEESNAALLKGNQGRKLVEGWGKFLQALWQDPTFQPHLQEIYYTTKSPRDFYTSALLPITTIHHSTYLPHKHKLQIPTPNTFITHSLSCPDPAPLPFPATSSSTSSTSTTSLPLSLLLAATRLTALHDPGLNSTSTTKPTSLNLSFSIAYTEYVRLLTSAKASASASGVTATAGRVWGRDVAREAWGKLVKWGVLVPVGSGANGVEDGGGGVGGGGGGGMEDGRMYRAEVSFEEVVDLVGVGGSLGRWWRDG